MTEFEKMVACQNYDGWDAEIVAKRRRTRKLQNKLNQWDGEDDNERQKIVAEILGDDNPTIYIEPPFHCDYGTNIKLGDNAYFNFNATILDEAPVTIGKNTKFGPNCSLYTACHPLDPAKRREHIEFSKPITVGDDCWIGGNVVICPGVTIGKNTTIGAGSVVVKDIPEGVVAVGNPCHVVKKLDIKE